MEVSPWEQLWQAVALLSRSSEGLLGLGNPLHTPCYPLSCEAASGLGCRHVAELAGPWAGWMWLECYGAGLESELKRLTEHFIFYWGLCLGLSVKIKDQAALFAGRRLGKSQQNYGFSIPLQL